MGHEGVWESRTAMGREGGRRAGRYGMKARARGIDEVESDEENWGTAR